MCHTVPEGIQNSLGLQKVGSTKDPDFISCHEGACVIDGSSAS